MAFYRQEDDILSPIHFGSSLVDSSLNSEGSLSSIKINDVECAGKEQFNQFSGLDSREEYDVFSPLSDNFSVASLSKKSSFPLSPLTSVLSPSKRLSSDIKIQSSRQVTYTSSKSARLRKEQADNNETNPRTDLNENNDVKQQSIKKLVRPTTLSPLTRWSEECGFNNQASEKIIFTAKKMDAAHELSNPLEKNCDSTKIDFISETSSVQEKKSAQDVEKAVFRGAELANPKRAEHDLKKAFSSSGSNLEDQVIQRMVEDCVSFEADQICQILYDQQTMFFKHITNMKMSMEQQHLCSTNRLCQLVEALAEINVALKERLSK